jgi:hypothetical protein
MSKSIEAIYDEISGLIEELPDSAVLSAKFDAVSSPLLCRYYSGQGVTSADFISVVQQGGIDYAINAAGRRHGIVAAVTFNLVGRPPPVTDLCSCGGRIEMKYDYTYTVCAGCGEMRAAIDMRSREDNSGLDAAPKRAVHSPTKHYEHWAARIQGLEQKEFTLEQLNSIKAVLCRDKIPPRTLTCEIMRTVLADRAVGLSTDLNEHVTKLVTRFSGKKPYQLTPAESLQAREIFTLIMYYYERQHPSGGNRPYYPYFIYRIYEWMFRGDQRRLSILRYIHLQSDDTVCKHDKDLQSICEEAGSALPLKYTATNRHT